MSSILDIDLDYFAVLDNPVKRLSDLMEWANQPVNTIVEKHHKILNKWNICVNKGIISPPTSILHVDEHHDMMDEKKTLNIANYLYHAMRKWHDCRVYWLVAQPIDSPELWLSEDIWNLLVSRFSTGAQRPQNWPRPNLVTVCISPEFVAPILRYRLLKHIEQWNNEFNFSNIRAKSVFNHTKNA